MKIRLKPIERQTMVITGATSGIGLATARMAARRGAKLVLAARSEDALRKLVSELEAQGTRAICVTADVSREEDVQKIADKTTQRFAGFDTWVNNAGVSIYGPLLDVPVEEERRLFDMNYWSVVYGSRIAAKYLRYYRVLSLTSVAWLPIGRFRCRPRIRLQNTRLRRIPTRCAPSWSTKRRRSPLL
jgi:short-subunit dehydrogenase